MECHKMNVRELNYSEATDQLYKLNRGDDVNNYRFRAGNGSEKEYL